MGHGYSTGPDIHSSEEVWTFFTKYSLAGSSAIGPGADGNPARGAFSVRRVPGMLRLQGSQAIGSLRIADSQGRKLGGWESGGRSVFTLDIPAAPARRPCFIEVRGASGETKASLAVP